jgi:pSer/pThr/pTyr-binding forkhead associated (FHA) protein
MFTLAIRDKHGAIIDEGTFEEGEILLGRSQSADVVLPSDNVSRKHARIYTVDGRCYVEDFNSANGVFVNGRRIHEAHEVQGSAQVKIGDYYILIEGGGPDDGVFCRLEGHNLAFADQVYEIKDRVTLVGRGKDCELTFIDGSISRAHAKLSIDPSGSIILEDLNSSNGTFVDDEPVQVRTLSDGANIRFGNAEFTLKLPEANTGQQHLGQGAWQGAPAKSRTGLWVVMTIAVAIVAAGIVILAVFADDIFKSSGGSGGEEGADGKTSTEACNPVAQKGCSAEEACTYVEDGTSPVCQPKGAKKRGEGCEVATDCAHGICVSLAAIEDGRDDGDAKLCHKFCKEDNDCGLQTCATVKDKPFKVCLLDKNDKAIRDLLIQARKAIKERNWAVAKLAYEKINKLDATDIRRNNVTAQINTIDLNLDQQKLVHDAKRWLKTEMPENIRKAARNLWQIKKAFGRKEKSYYTNEALGLLKKLQKDRKATLLISVQNQSTRKCAGLTKALAIYEAVLAIDGTDSKVRTKRDKLRAKSQSKRCPAPL